MRSICAALLFSVLTSVFLLTPAVTHAQGFPSFTGHIVPCGQSCVTDDDQRGIRECETCHLVVMVQRILTFLVFLGGVISIFMFLWAGFTFLRATGNISVIKEAKEKFYNTLWGFIIVLAAWALVDVLISIFYDRDRLGPWNEIICGEVDVEAAFRGAAQCTRLERPSLRGERPDPVYDPPTGEFEVGDTTFGFDPELIETDDPELAARAEREAEVRERLLNAGVDVRRGFCAVGSDDVFGGATDCVDVGELDEEVIVFIENFAELCEDVRGECSLFIERGSESGDTGSVVISSDDGGALTFQQILDTGILGEPQRVNEGLMTYDVYTDEAGNQYRVSADGSAVTITRESDVEPLPQLEPEPEPEPAPIEVFDPETIPDPEPEPEEQTPGEIPEDESVADSVPEEVDPAEELARLAQRERAVRDELEDAGIVTQQLGTCGPDATADSSCTSVRDLDREVIDAMVRFSETCTYCGGDMMVVSGSEDGVSSSASLVNPQGLPLRTHLDDNFTHIGDTPEGRRVYTDDAGVVYQLSQDHLEVSVLVGDAAQSVVSRVPPPSSQEPEAEEEQEGTSCWLWGLWC